MAASKVLNEWKGTTPSNEAYPIPAMVLYAAVVLAWAYGRPDDAVVLLLCFRGLFRIGEVLSLRLCDVLLPQQHLGGQALIIVLVSSKSGVAGTETVLLTNPRVIAFVKALIARQHRSWLQPLSKTTLPCGKHSG